MGRHVVGRAVDLPCGGRRIVDVDRKSIGIFNSAGRLFAIRNACPHQGAPLCRGEVTGLAESDDPSIVRWSREGEILRCPWHSWEFDLDSGRALAHPTHRVKTYRVDVEEGEIVLYT